MVLKKEDYIKSLKHIEMKKIEKKVNFIKKIPIF